MERQAAAARGWFFPDRVPILLRRVDGRLWSGAEILHFPLPTADGPFMHWLFHLGRSGLDGEDPAIKDILRQSMEARSRVELLPVHRSSTEERPFVTTVEDLGEGGFVVAMPTLGGTVRPLGRFELYQMTVGHPQKLYAGATGSLGRMRFKTASGATQPGYRLTYPETLQPVERRRDVRKVLGKDIFREASIQIAQRKGPILGFVEDISARGIRVRCRNAVSDVREGTQGHLRLDLAEPIGPIAEMVRIIAIEADADSGDVIIRAQFIQPVEAIARVLDGACSAIRRSSGVRHSA